MGEQAKYQVRLETIGRADVVAKADIVVVAEALPSLATADQSASRVTLRNRSAIADRILAEQQARGRVSVTILVAGEGIATENLLAAGALVDALSARGIDHTSPSAAATEASFLGLRHALRHLVGASEAAAGLTAGQIAYWTELDADRDIAASPALASAA